jgi:CHAD domain-containing protein
MPQAYAAIDMEHALMMTPKDPKKNSRESAESPDQQDLTAAIKPQAKKTIAKGISASHHVTAAKTIKPRSPKNTKKAASIAETLPDASSVVQVTVNSSASTRVGDYAHRLIQQHFERMLHDHQIDVLDDRSPEALHQMRVHGRRLRTTIALFSTALNIPKQGQIKQLRRFHRTLGTLRNLDVVIARLQQDYYPELPESEQSVLDRCFKKLKKQRRRALEDVQVAIAEQTFEATYAAWLKQPEYHTAATQTLTHVLPQLLLPDLTAFLAQPGWAIAAADVSLSHPVALHNLRKAVKQQRYQLEAVSPICGAAVAAWIVDLKAIQDCLGTLQDLAVLQEIVPDAIALPTFMARLQTQQQVALAPWDQLRQPYRQPQFHYQCYEAILQVLMVSK